jgi:hypothetical protein
MPNGNADEETPGDLGSFSFEEEKFERGMSIRKTARHFGVSPAKVQRVVAQPQPAAA